jgi:hypothetical protein
MRRISIAAGVTALLIALAAPALAQDGTPIHEADMATAPDQASSQSGVSPAEMKQAIALFKEGNDRLRAGSDGSLLEAVDKYRAALTHWDHPAIHYNLALALVNLDRPLELHAELVQALADGPAPLGEDKFARAKDFMTLVEKQLVQVEYTVTTPGAVLMLDGAQVMSGPGTYKAMVRAGAHSLAAQAEGYVPTRLNLKLVGGEPSRLELELFTLKQLTRTRRRMPVWVPYAVIGAGVAAGAAGGWLHVQSADGFDQYDRAIAGCAAVDPTHGCSAPSPDDTALESSAKRDQSLAVTLYAVGGAVLVTGAVLAIVNRAETYRIDPISKQRSDEIALEVTPIIGPGVAGLAAALRF